MKTKHLLLASTLLFATNVFGQTKLDMGLNHLVSQQKVQQAKSKTAGKKVTTNESRVSVLVQLKAGTEIPTAQIEAMDIKVTGRYGSFASMVVPVSQLEALSQLDVVKAVEQSRQLKIMNKTSQEADHAVDVKDETKAAAAGLPQSYSGKGVIAAVVDYGIDYNHVNFRDPETKQTRIKEAILYRNYVVDGDSIVDKIGEGGKRVYPDDIREVYTDAATIDTLTSDSKTGSHGTHTSSTIAGSYSGNYLDRNGNVTYSGIQGVAPQTDLLLAGLGKVIEDNCAIDALAYFDKKADELQEPMVVSLSFGSFNSWMDGNNIYDNFFNEYTENGNKPGRIVCMAAGNSGSDHNTIYQELNSTNNHKIQTAIERLDNGLKIGIFSSGKKPLGISIDCYNMDREQSGYETIAYKLEKTFTSTDLENLGLFSGNTYDNHDGRYAAFINVDKESCILDILDVDASLYILRVESDEDCKVRLFCENSWDSSRFYSDQYFGGLVQGDASSSINTFVCTNSILSVANWCANTKYKLYYTGEEKDDAYETVGDIDNSSSYISADDNGITRPDFAAPGEHVISGYNIYDTHNWDEGELAGEYDEKICGKAETEYKEGHTSIIGNMNGTSMACPNAAGVIALWLQANPQLTVNQLRDVIKATADNDDYTKAAPERFGAGKINALEGLKYILKNYPTAIHNVEDETISNNNEVRKAIVNGRLCIKKGDKTYDVVGRRL